MKLAASASIFKNLLLKWYGEKCSCGVCILCKLNQLWCPILCEDVYRNHINGYRSITFYSFYGMCSCCLCAFYVYCNVTCYDWPPCAVQITNVWMCHACLPIRSKDHTILHPPYSISTYTHSIVHLHLPPSHLSLNSLKLMLLVNLYEMWNKAFYLYLLYFIFVLPISLMRILVIGPWWPRCPFQFMINQLVVACCCDECNKTDLNELRGTSY